MVNKNERKNYEKKFSWFCNYHISIAIIVITSIFPLYEYGGTKQSFGSTKFELSYITDFKYALLEMFIGIFLFPLGIIISLFATPLVTLLEFIGCAGFGILCPLLFKRINKSWKVLLLGLAIAVLVEFTYIFFIIGNQEFTSYTGAVIIHALIMYFASLIYLKIKAKK